MTVIRLNIGFDELPRPASRGRNGLSVHDNMKMIIILIQLNTHSDLS